MGMGGSMNPASILCAVMAATALTTTQAFAEEVSVGIDQQTGIAVTIYNNDLALIHDQRQVDLKAGLNELAFIDVSADIRPQTAQITVEGGGLTVTEQNFDFDLLTPQKLLEKSVGGAIRVIRTNPATGADSSEEAKVLSVSEGLAVLQIGDRIETAVPGRLVFSAVPPNLRVRPTLVAKALSDKAGPTTVTLSYLSRGLSWQADYAASLSADETTIDLNGLVTLTNQSGIAYVDAELELVAGDVNQVMDKLTYEKFANIDIETAAGPGPMAEAPSFEYHLYRLDTPVTIQQNQTKQVAMMAASGVPVAKQYWIINAAEIWNSYSHDTSEDVRINATVKLKFINDEKSRLGMPLPEGVVRVYKSNSRGKAVFVGEDSIDHTPKNDEAILTLGQAFDITARVKQTDYQRMSEQVYENEYEIEIKNAKKEAVTVDLREHMSGTWKILTESQEHRKLGANTVGWLVDVPAEGSTKLSYRARTEF
jgi:hypothetical protein